MSRNRRLLLYAVATAGWVAGLAGLMVTLWALVAALFQGAPLLDRLLRSDVLPWLAAGIAGALVWAVCWAIANRSARPLTIAGAAERAASARKAHMYLALLAALAALVGQAWGAVRAGIFWFLGGASGQAQALALAAGGLLALAAWGYMRWQTVRDGDAGREAKRARSWRRLYTYTAAAAGTLMAAAGLGETLRTLVRLGFQPLSGSAGWHQSFAGAVAAMAVGSLLAFVAWRRANRLAALAPERELQAPMRLAVQYGGLALFTLMTLASLIYLIQQVILFALGRSAGPYWQAALAYLPVGVAGWLGFVASTRRDAAAAGELPRAATARRAERYLVAGIALVAFSYGLIEFIRIILLMVLQVQAPAQVFSRWWERFALAAALVLVAAPAWWGHWWSQQTRARAGFPEGRPERASTIRRIYLYLVIVASAVLAFVGIGIGIYVALNGRQPGTMNTSYRAALAGASAMTLVGLFWWITHALTLRGDARLLAQDAQQKHALENQEPAVVTASQPRSYRREELLPPVSPLDPIVVMDGADGAWGAAVILALRRAAPMLPVWPYGLNPAAHIAMVGALGEAAPPMAPENALAKALAVVGPAEILVAGSLDGEVTQDLVQAVLAGPGQVLVLPPREPRVRWVGVPAWSLTEWAENAAVELQNLVAAG